MRRPRSTPVRDRVHLRPSPHIALLTASVAAALAARAPAQLQFAELHQGLLPHGADDTATLAIVDVDGDGDLDLVCGNRSAQNSLYLNRGDGIFFDASAQLPALVDDTEALAAGDVDGDGDQDLVVGNSGPDRLLLNDGSGVFVAAPFGQLPSVSADTHALALADVDGDGDLDLVCGSGGPWYAQQNRLYLNNGTGSFTDGTAAKMPTAADSTTSLALGDVDNDGDLDVVFGNQSYYTTHRNRLYVNDGTGTFSDATAAQLPLDSENTADVAFGDIDNDGDLDLVAGNSSTQYTGQDRLYLNNGSGFFVDGTAGRLPASLETTESFAVEDVDMDGDLDLVGTRRLLVNDGSGVFSNAATTQMPSVSYAFAVELGDVDGDGDPDAVFGNRSIAGANRLLLNDGAGTFADHAARRLPANARSWDTIAVGDTDGDGDLDVVGGDALFLNDGRGWLADAGSPQWPLIWGTVCVVLGDVDGDGDLDVFVGNGGQDLLLLNNGSGTFVAAAQNFPAGTTYSSDADLGDVDNDGDLDLVVVSPPRLYHNNGSGVFTTAAGLPGWTGWSLSAKSVVFGDVDGDSDLDIVVAAAGNGADGQDRLFVNNGSGVFSDFTAARMPALNTNSRHVALGDVDGDGDLDAVFANYLGQQNRLYLNDGSGTFTDATAARLPADSNDSEAVALGDVDGDGDLDIVFGNAVFQSGQANSLYVNDGTGVFTDVTASRLPSASQFTEAVALADLDADGDLDILFGNDGGQRNTLLVNLHRGLHAPNPLLHGRSYVLDAYMRYGPPGTSDLALPAVSFAQAPTAVQTPFGALGIDPSLMVGLPLITVPQPAGIGSLSLSIPNLPGLVGTQVHLQALLVTSTVQARLSNVVFDVLR